MNNKKYIISNLNRKLGKTCAEENLVKSIIGEDFRKLAIVKHSTHGLIKGDKIKIIDTKKRGSQYSVIAQDMDGRILKIPTKYIKSIYTDTDTKTKLAKNIINAENVTSISVVSKSESRIPPHRPGHRHPKPHKNR